jgi:hypothetical protein
VKLPELGMATESVPVPAAWSGSLVIKRRFETNSAALAKKAIEAKQFRYKDQLFRFSDFYTTGFEKWPVATSTTEHRFNQLAQQWKAETALLSDLSKKSIHPAYQSIIGMGQDALPLLLRELERHPSHWFWALRAITGANPVKPDNRGRIKRMAQDWLEWGRDHGYQW